VDKLADLTLDEFKKLVEETVDQRLAERLGTFEIPDELDADYQRSWDEIRASVERHRVTLPPGAKSSLELLREDRDL
jgi:hypothetical protein